MLDTKVPLLIVLEFAKKHRVHSKPYLIIGSHKGGREDLNRLESLIKRIENLQNRSSQSLLSVILVCKLQRFHSELAP